MNGDWKHEQITALFRDLRQADRRLTPPFSRVWEAARSRVSASPGPRRVSRLLAAGSALVIIGAVSFIAGHLRRPPTWEFSIFRWQSPTAALLTLPGEGIVKTIPRLGAPMGDITINPTKKNGGAR